MIGETVCEIAPPSLQLLHTYCVPVPPFWVDVVLIVWLEPVVQENVCAPLYVIPSTVNVSPDGLVRTVTWTPPVVIVTLAGDEAMPLAMTTSVLAPVSIPAGTSKLVETV